MNNLALALALAPALSAFAALSPADLQARLNRGEKPTIIDVRTLGLYEKGHIPGAINIPSMFCSQKSLPRLGAVVVYDGGLGRDEATPAAAALSAKPGITAEVLQGGFAAWLQAKGPSTHAHGVQPDETPLISYADLKAAQGTGVVLVDLRKPILQARQDAGNAPPPAPLTDLRKEFPAAAVAPSPFNLPQTRQSGSGSVPPLLVLIDSGDGAAQAMAAALKANGATRFVILAGGESILTRHGEPGLHRVTTSTLPLTPPPAITNK